MSHEAPPIEVVTVNHDAGDALVDSVAAVLASSVPVRVCVVDNASRDGSLEALERRLPAEPRLHVIRNGQNAGFARANNQVLRGVSDGYALLLNPDCVVEAGTLERVVAALEADPEAGMAGCLLLGLDGREQAGCRRAAPTPRTALLRAFGLLRPVAAVCRALGWVAPADFVLNERPLPEAPLAVDAISGAFMLVRSDALASVGLLDEGFFLHGEDLDWCLRFREAGYRVLFVPGARAVHEKGRCSRRRPFFVQWHLHRGMARYHRKHHGGSALRVALVGLGVWTRFALVALPRAAWSALRG